MEVIEDYRFGSMTISGRRYDADVKIVHGSVVPNWWRRESHRLDAADVEDLLSAKPEVLVVGRGDPGRMKVTNSLRSALANAGIELIEEPTAQAAETYNALHRQGIKVAAAFHLTC